MKYRFSAVIFVIFFVTACGGGAGSTQAVITSSSSVASSSTSDSSVSSSSSSSSSSSVPAALLTGSFIGGPVIGIAYKTGSVEGFTNENGGFSYAEGEDITFSIGDIDFPSVLAEAEITPFLLAGSSHTGSVVASNIARLLQTLDADGNHLTGISITSEAHALAATGMLVDFESAMFGEQVVNLVANSGAVQGVLLDGDTAIENLLNALYPPYDCNSEHLRVDQRATFVTRAHQVSGDAKVINDCTIRITNFNYDGGGLPDVYVYAASNNNYTSGYRISENIYSQAYDDGVLNLEILNENLDDLDGISVWCEAASVSFGDGEFITF